MKTIATILLIFSAFLPAVFGETNLVVNGGFENDFTGWTRWGKNADLITLQTGSAHSGAKSVQIQYGHNSLYFKAPLQRSLAYEFRFHYRVTGGNPSGRMNLYFSGPDRALGSAGTVKLALAATNSPAWTEIRHVFLPPPKAVAGQFSFSAGEHSALWLDDVSLEAIPKPDDLPEPPDPWEGLRRRTERPLFRELLTSAAGHYHVVSWTHDLQRKTKSGAWKSEEFQDDQRWRKELATIFKESAQAGMGFLDLPSQLDRSEPWRTTEFHRRQFQEYGVRYDVWTEGSVSLKQALANGAELLNPSDVALNKRPEISWVDPRYVAAQEKILRTLGSQLRGEPFVGAYYGKDEPMIHLPEGKPERWGAYGQAMAKEVLENYGAGRFAAPLPGDREFEHDPNKPLRWIAYNRWASDRFAATRQQLYAALHEADTNAVYTGANYWFMSGFVPYDYSRLAATADLMELDPYASSAEIRRGRGVFNHSFGAKFMRDLTGKPVRVVAQAFDYRGYAMTPDDLREWVSQAMRGGASAIDYYTMDSPRWTHRERWEMMLHLSRQITRMNRIALPDDPDTAVLYTLYTHMSHGENSNGDQLYTAHAVIGELSGSWFKFVSDAQLERDQASLAGYKVVYLPLAKYMTAAATRQIEDYVRAGGVLICGDAEAFTSDLAGNDTRAAQERVLGFRTAGPSKATSLTLKSSEFGLPIGSTLKLLAAEPSDPTGPRSIILTDTNAVIVAAYPDGTPAIVSRQFGKGRVIAFAANPFAPQVTVDKSLWPALFKGMQQSLGCKVDRPIWRFLIPPRAESPSNKTPRAK